MKHVNVWSGNVQQVRLEVPETRILRLQSLTLRLTNIVRGWHEPWMTPGIAGPRMCC